MPDVKKEIGTRIKRLREGKEKKETQQDLANAISVSKDLISKIEQGKAKVSIDDAIAIAKHYGISLDWICGITDDIDDSNKTLDILLKFLKFTTRTMSWSNSNKNYHILSLLINKDLDQLLNVLQKEERFKKDNLPEELIMAWVNGEKKKFTDAIKNDSKIDFIEYALLSNEHLSEDIMKILEQLYD